MFQFLFRSGGSLIRKQLNLRVNWKSHLPIPLLTKRSNECLSIVMIILVDTA